MMDRHGVAKQHNGPILGQIQASMLLLSIYPEVSLCSMSGAVTITIPCSLISNIIPTTRRTSPAANDANQRRQF